MGDHFLLVSLADKEIPIDSYLWRDLCQGDHAREHARSEVFWVGARVVSPTLAVSGRAVPSVRSQWIPVRPSLLLLLLPLSLVGFLPPPGSEKYHRSGRI
jgi:hypothetical protein